MSSQDLERMLAVLRQQWRRIEAPPRVEAALRSAFRAQRPLRRAWEHGALAVAAGVVVMAGAAVWQLWKMEQPLPNLTIRVQSAPPPPVQLWQAPQMAAEQRTPKAVGPAAAAAAVVEANVPPAGAARRAPKVVHPAPPAPAADEIATDFLPLDGTLSLAPIERGQVLRVQVPRSTLVRFGLPVNQERLMDPIDADVVFAQDGIARAIRFVK